MTAIANLTGQLFGFLTVIGPASARGGRWRCHCRCGRKLTMPTHSLRSGNTKSCGCGTAGFIAASKLKHGLSHKAEYYIWAGMNRRCDPENVEEYPHHAGRGIKVCARWSKSVANFIADMGPRPSPNHSIDRINNNGNYTPKNCRWATKSEQSANTRSNRRVVYRGKEMNFHQAVKLSGVVTYKYAFERLRRGWTIERALDTIPIPKGVRRDCYR